MQHGLTSAYQGGQRRLRIRRPRLLAVADGMGGAAAGEVASSVAVAAFARLDEDEPSGDLLLLLRGMLRRAEGQLKALTDSEPGLSGMGTTVTAMIRSGTASGCSMSATHVAICYAMASGTDHS